MAGSQSQLHFDQKKRNLLTKFIKHLATHSENSLVKKSTVNSKSFLFF